jgi:hypothetical protein
MNRWPKNISKGNVVILSLPAVSDKPESPHHHPGPYRLFGHRLFQTLWHQKILWISWSLWPHIAGCLCSPIKQFLHLYCHQSYKLTCMDQLEIAKIVFFPCCSFHEFKQWHGSRGLMSSGGSSEDLWYQWRRRFAFYRYISSWFAAPEHSCQFYFSPLSQDRGIGPLSTAHLRNAFCLEVRWLCELQCKQMGML